MTDNNGFMIFNSYAEWVNMLTDEEAGKLLKALIEYNTNGSIPAFSDGERVLQIAFCQAKNNIDIGIKKHSIYSNNGKNGGAPLGNQNAKKQPNSSQNNQNQPKNNLIQAKTNEEKGKEEKGKEEKGKEENNISCADAHETPPKQKRSVFVPPTLEEAKQYAQDNNISIDVSRFIDYYTANGWKVGHSSMKDWKAAMRNWGRRDNKPGAKSGTVNTDGAIDQKFVGSADWYGK